MCWELEKRGWLNRAKIAILYLTLHSPAFVCSCIVSSSHLQSMGFSCTTPINFNQSQEKKKMLSQALWKRTPPFLTIILLHFVRWEIFRRQSWMLHHFNTCSSCIMVSARLAACSALQLTSDFATQMTKWLTLAFLYMKQIQILQGDSRRVLCMCLRLYRMGRWFRKIRCYRPLTKIVARIPSSHTR